MALNEHSPLHTSPIALDVYQHILQTSSLIKSRNFVDLRNVPITPAEPLSPTVTPLQLELPSQIQLQLNLLPPSLQSEFRHALDMLVAHYVEIFDQTWRRLATDIRHPAYRTALPMLIERLRNVIRYDFERTVKQHIPKVTCNLDCKQGTDSDEPDDSRPSFNQEYIPFLQKYFEFDSYPSSRDREIMAKKSGMTSRQIEVWFQNHRRVARKTGARVTPKRTPGATVPPSLSLEFADERMPLFKASEEHDAPNITQIEMVEKIVLDEEKAQLAEEQSKYYSVVTPRYIPTSCARDLLNPPAPPTAFPAAWSKPDHQSQFRYQVNRPTFPVPVWPRKCTIPLKKSKLTGKAAAKANDAKKATEHAAYEEMMSRMAFLSLLDSEVLSKERKGRSNEVPAPPAATCAYTYVLPKAPHPAFVIPGSSLLSAPSSSARTTSNATAYPQITPSRRRKVAGFPRRKPGNPPNSTQRSRRTTASPSPAPSAFSRSPSPSRTPSLDSSPSSSLHRQSSISSISSSFSADPPTPKSSSASLPSISIAGVDDAREATFNPYRATTRSVSPLDVGIPFGFPAGFTMLSGSGDLLGDQTKQSSGWQGYYSFSNVREQHTQQDGR